MSDPIPVFQQPPSMPSAGMPRGVVQPQSSVQSPTSNMGAAQGMPPPPFNPSTLPPNPALTPEKPTVTLAQTKDIQKSPFRFLPWILLLLLVLGAGWFVVSRFLFPQTTTGPSINRNVTPPSGGQTGGTTTTPTQTKTLTYWGLWEPGNVMAQVLRDFEAQNPGVKVNYVQQSPTDYRERLQDALQKGQGPDIFRYHATWIPMLRTQLSAAPSSIMTTTEFNQTYYPIMQKDLVSANGVLGIPFMYDGLGLYYNKKIFQTAAKTPPTLWSDVETTAKTLTVRSKDGKTIDRAGIALGTTTNIDNFSDIVGLLLLQNGANPANPSTQLAADALKYYTNFFKIHKVWDDTSPNSTYAFATEKVAMILAPSWRAFEIKSINPALDFGIAPVPQLPGTNVTWASYWAEGVSKTSKEQDLSWKLIKYLGSRDVLQKFSTAAAQNTPRLFGEIYPRTDMGNLLAADPYVGAYIQDAPKAQSWYLSSRTFDNGINDQIIKYYEDAINAVNTGKTTLQEALVTVDKGVKQVLQLFGAVSAAQ